MTVSINGWVIRDWADRRQDMLRWCYENSLDYKVSDDRMTWTFKKEEDATMFILMWQNRI